MGRAQNSIQLILGIKRRSSAAVTVSGKDGMTTTSYYLDGDHMTLHRADRPARVTVTRQGLREEWFDHGRRHRDGGPALTVAGADGSHSEAYYNHGQPHREPAEGPAYQTERAPTPTYPSNSGITYGYADRTICFYDHGRLHRVGGPARSEQWADGSTVDTFYEQGLEHRESGPSSVRTGQNGRVVEEWRQRGRLHRDGGPAITSDGPTGHSEGWCHDGEYDREDGPAIVVTTPSGFMLENAWYRQGLRHREDGPAVSKNNVVGQRIEEWWRGGVLDREDGPARTAVEAGGARSEFWYRQGLRHRADGPAVTTVEADGHRHQEYWLDGKPVTSEAPQ